MRQLNHPYWLFGFLVLGISLQAFEFSGPFPTKDYPYTIHKSGEEVCTDCPSVVAWLDNDRVIFTRLKKGEPFLQMKTFNPFAFNGETVIWDTKKDRVIPYHDGMLWCSYDGYSSIFYNREKLTNHSVYTYTGFIGKEIDKSAWKQGDPLLHSDKHTCVVYDGPRYKPDTPNWTYPLREQDGFIDIGWKKDRNDPRPATSVGVIRPDGTRINLSLTNYDVHGVWWDEWAGVYILNMFLYGGFDKSKGPDRVLTLHPDGTIERYELPYAYYWNKDTVRAAITKKGIVVVNERANYIPARKDTSGAYLIRGDKFVRLNDWYVGNEKAGYNNITRGLAVSPDGCKITYKHTNGLRENTVSTIEMINLCEGEE
ncbi:hypothetical protein [Sulfuricurvum sp.]|uniref:hypothetical protein n=1 Tax=Sulfuricurvum sp. TaxID=2025608 RepID=UPI002618BB11|nr:hypothetical protein [Sulfuricurvum sp.]MDD4950700.1 hypothetical protein [Sulfuricurvum sp.]